MFIIGLESAPQEPHGTLVSGAEDACENTPRDAIPSPKLCDITEYALSSISLGFSRLAMDNIETETVVTETEILLRALRQELKEWEASFFAAHKRKAGREDIKQHPEIGNF